jgi:DNA topoisomerase-1
MAEKKSLVILESPAKAKTVEKYLGKEFTVTASMGHLRDLPESKFGVDIEAGYVPTYVPMKGKEATISSLKSLVKKSGSVYLATDPDREGEAIAWHLKEMLEIPDNKAFRVTFNEITQKVVTEGIKSPRSLDMDLVDAQQARRVLDRIVGYQLSPLLWKKIRRGLSAGRVQSVTTKMVVDREREIRAFIPQEYWELDAVLKTESGADFTARFYGNGSKQQELHNQSEVSIVMEAVSRSSFSVNGVKRGTRKRNPSPPFETSTLQQDASRRLNFNPRKTMSVAQELYENGLITYMRTDSLRISPDAQADARSYAVQKWGADYVPEKPNIYKTKSGAQDAHEAIRPSNASLAPEVSGLAGDRLRLYRLIWSRFMASQMSPAVYDTFEIDAISAGYIFRATESNLKFPGFLAAYDSDGEASKKNKKPLPADLAAGDPLTLVELLPEQKFTQPPARYSEDSLIQAMKELGIGRPSTYAPTISVIEGREYVVKEGKSLKPSPLGETVTQFLEEMFPSIVDVDFTANMELELDTVADGSRKWKAVLDEFYKSFEPKLKDAEASPRYKVPVEETEEVCELCGKPMVIRSGRFGRFLSCSGFPDCTNARPITVTMPGQCPKCGGTILKREGKSKTSGRKYTIYVCEKGKDVCDFSTFDVPTPDYCPECGKTMFKKSGKGAKKPFCINEECSLFLPEDKRGGWTPKQVTENAAPDKKTAKKPSANRSAKK